MSPGKINLELKVGIFAFISLIVLTWIVFSISEVYVFSPGYLVEVSFSFASGISEGAPVRVAGVQVGEVKKIEMGYAEDQTQIMLSVWLDKEVRLPRDSKAYVNVLGLIGETYLEVIPGEDYAHLLEGGDKLIGHDPFSTETMMEAVHKVADNFDNVLGSIDEVLDEETKLALKQTVLNLRDTSDSLKVITGRLERGEGKLGAWLKPRRKRVIKKKSEPQESKKVEATQNFGTR